MLLLDDQPFFVMQCRHLPAGGTWRAMAHTGFNCLRHRLFGAGDDRNGQTGTGQPSLPSPEELAGLKLCVYLWDRVALDADSGSDELATVVAQLKDDPNLLVWETYNEPCLLYTSPSPRDATLSRMPSSA